MVEISECHIGECRLTLVKRKPEKDSISQLVDKQSTPSSGSKCLIPKEGDGA